MFLFGKRPLNFMYLMYMSFFFFFLDLESLDLENGGNILKTELNFNLRSYGVRVRGNKCKCTYYGAIYNLNYKVPAPFYAL